MRHFVLHVIRCGVWLGALLWVSLGSADSALMSLLAAPLAAGLFMMTFSLFHDAAHGALDLPPRVNDVVLFMTSAPLMMSAHGQRQLHLRHHARPLAPDDLEGAGALSSLGRAFLEAPRASVDMRIAGVTSVNGRVRAWVIAENALNAAVAAAAVLSDQPGLQLAFVTALVLQMTMNAWASHIPHRAPRWLLGAAAQLAWTRSPVILALVYHMEHHAQPRLPCAVLAPTVALDSPLTAHAETLRWAQLQLHDRPRPRARLRGMA